MEVLETKLLAEQVLQLLALDRLKHGPLYDDLAARSRQVSLIALHHHGHGYRHEIAFFVKRHLKHHLFQLVPVSNSHEQRLLSVRVQIRLVQVGCCSKRSIQSIMGSS